MRNTGPCTSIFVANVYCVGTRKQTKQNRNKNPSPATKKHGLFVVLHPSPGLWYLSPALRAVEAVGRLIDAAGQAGGSLPSARLPLIASVPKGARSQPFCHILLFLLRHTLLIYSGTCALAVPGKCSCAVSRLGVSFTGWFSSS